MIFNVLNPSIFTSIIDSYLPEPHASLLNGILFGIDIKTTKEFYQQLKIVGLLHIVVLSGTNITILSTIISFFTQNFSKHISNLITIFVIILFILFVGFEAPIVRAGFMGILTVVSFSLGRKNWALYSLILSAVFISIFWPKWLKTISFQLSYAATLGIILFGYVKVYQPKNHWERLKLDLKKNLKPSLSAQLFTAPIIFIYFKQISLISPLSNLLVVPFIPSLMILGFLTAILGKIHFFFGLPFAYLCYGILEYMIFVINFLSDFPFVFIQF